MSLKDREIPPVLVLPSWMYQELKDEGDVYERDGKEYVVAPGFGEVPVYEAKEYNEV